MSRISLSDILDYTRAQAIADALQPTEESNWRKICRDYSKKFYTPLDKVLVMAPEEVCLAFFEDQMDERDVEKELDAIMDTIYSIEDPEYESEKKAELSDFMKEAEREEEERIKAGRAIHPALKAENEVSIKNTPDVPEDAPKGGSVNFAYLADHEEEQ